MKKNPFFVALIVIALIWAVVIIIASATAHKADACGIFTSCDTKPNAQEVSNKVAGTVMENVPVPQLQTSSERKNVARRAEIFNNEDKISYIYLVSYGKVMAFYTVQGKVSSLRSYMTPEEKVVYGNGDNCSKFSENCYVVGAPDIDGTYGENVDGIFFFTTEGAYVEWRGDYMMSDQPLKLSTQPELIREIQ